MGEKLISNNKKIYHDYFVLEKYEAGIALKGTEIKSLRMGKCSIAESICRIDKGEVYIFGMNISPYEKGNIFNVDSTRTRKLLLHKKQILKIQQELMLSGNSLLPVRVYLKEGLAKVEIALCKGKKKYDKREDIKKKDIKRNLDRKFKGASIKV